MSDELLEFDDTIALALAESVARPPSAHVRQRLMARIAALNDVPPVPAGFTFRFDEENGWVPHPVPGIRMKVLALNRERDYATLLLDVAPGTRFPPHHHTGAEECYIISGTAYSYGRRMTAGDFLHADAGTDHSELYTDEGCRVLLVVPPEDYMPDPQ